MRTVETIIILLYRRAHQSKLTKNIWKTEAVP